MENEDREHPDVAGPLSNAFDAVGALHDQYGDLDTGKALGIAGAGVAAVGAVASGDPDEIAGTGLGVAVGTGAAIAAGVFTGPGFIAAGIGFGAGVAAEGFYDTVSDPSLDPDWIQMGALTEETLNRAGTEVRMYQMIIRGMRQISH